jgi:hypothetical protein
MAYVTRLPQHLVINNVPMSTPAWEHLNLYALYSGANVRGQNRVMPGAVGVMPLRRRPTETNRTLQLAVYGNQSWDGTPYSDPIAGLATNIGHLLDNVVNTLLTPLSVVTAQIVGNGPTQVAAIQVLGFEVDDEMLSPAAVYASMDITLIEGRFQ